MTTTLCLGLDAHRVQAAICEKRNDRQQLVTWHALDLDKPLLPKRHMPSATDPALAAVDTVLDHIGSLVEAELRLPEPNSDSGTSDAVWRMERLYLTLDPLPPLRVWLCALTPVWQKPVETVVRAAAGHLLGTTSCRKACGPWSLSTIWNRRRRTWSCAVADTTLRRRCSRA